MLKSVNELFHLTNINREVIRRRLADIKHEPGPNRAKLYETHDVLPILYGAGGGRLDPAQERAQLDRERRRQIELANQKQAGELIPVQDVIETWTTRVQRAKGRLLGLPARLSPEMVRVSSQRDAERLIRAPILDALRALSEQDEPD